MLPWLMAVTGRRRNGEGPCSQAAPVTSRAPSLCYTLSTLWPNGLSAAEPVLQTISLEMGKVQLKPKDSKEDRLSKSESA